jgi:hypothetical protein
VDNGPVSSQGVALLRLDGRRYEAGQLAQESGVWQERAAVCVIRAERKGSKEKE